MSDFIRGPWRAERRGYARRVEIVRNSGLRVVAQVSLGLPQQEAEACGRMLAAAPTLLTFAEDALAELLSERDSLSGSITTPGGLIPDPADAEALAALDRLIDRGRAAIAQASGGPDA